MTNCQFENIVVISATSKEMTAIDKLAGIRKSITGIGIANTMLNLESEITHNRPDLIIQIGICGAVSKELKLGQIVNITHDCIADIGAWREDSNIFVEFKQTIYSSIYSVELHLKNCVGITVNTACSPYIDRAGIDVESMEGAAMMAIAKKHNIPCLQIRTISNYIDSKREDWEIDKAIENLQKTMDILQKIVNFEK